jgi:TPR repeat protein
MTDTFEAAVQKMVKERGTAVFDNPARFKNLLADYTGNDFAKERKHLVRIVEEGYAKDIATAAEADIAKRIVLRRLMEEELFAEGPAAEMVDLLVLVRGDKDFEAAKALLDKGVTAKAIPLLQKLAAAGYIKAQNTLANCYEYGKGVHQDFEKAVMWYRKAAEQGDNDAQKVIVTLLNQGETDFETAKALLDKGATAKAIPLLQKLAATGYAKAQNTLGIYYANGKGVRQDQAMAVEWFRKAAEQGNVKAQYNLGNCYTNGNGYPRIIKRR